MRGFANPLDPALLVIRHLPVPKLGRLPQVQPLHLLHQLLHGPALTVRLHRSAAQERHPPALDHLRQSLAPIQ